MNDHDLSNQSKSELRRTHSREAIQRRLDEDSGKSYLKDFIYGAIDGTVTTFAVVSGVAGAGLDSSIILILGFANLIGDGFSMAASNYLGTQAELQQRKRLRRLEEDHIDRIPEGEREEISQIMKRQGFEGEALTKAVDLITADRERWVEMMLREEHGLSSKPPNPHKAATVTFVAFLLVGLLPLLSFMADGMIPSPPFDPYLVSTGMTLVAFFVVGAIKSRFTEQRWFWSGMETTIVGSLAAALAYLAGHFVQSLI